MLIIGPSGSRTNVVPDETPPNQAVAEDPALVVRPQLNGGTLLTWFAMSVADEIQQAVTSLALPTSEFALVPEGEARALFDSFLAHFTGGVDARWWWEHFVHPTSTLSLAGGKAFSRIWALVPDAQAKVWFVVEDEQRSFYPVYDATPAAAQAVIGECYGFEYYLIAKDLSWLLCENHHDRLIGVGDVVRRRMATSGP